MALPALLAPVVTFILRDVIVKFLALSAIFAVVVFLVPVASSFLVSFISDTALTTAFSIVSPGVWWVLDMFRLDFGVPLLISALVSRFLIRRLPVIG